MGKSLLCSVYTTPWMSAVHLTQGCPIGGLHTAATQLACGPWAPTKPPVLLPIAPAATVGFFGFLSLPKLLPASTSGDRAKQQKGVGVPEVLMWSGRVPGCLCNKGRR